MFPHSAPRLALAAAILVFAGCATRPLPRYEKPLAHTQYQTVRTTAYTHTESDHLQYGHSSALGDPLQNGAIKSAAADWARWPAGTLFRIQKTGELYQVDDYGWALAGTNTSDLYKPTRAAMNDWGVRRVHLEIQQWGDRQHSASVLSGRNHYAHCRRMLAELNDDRQPWDSLSTPTVTRHGDGPFAAGHASPGTEVANVRKPFRP